MDGWWVLNYQHGDLEPNNGSDTIKQKVLAFKQMSNFEIEIEFEI